MSRLRRLNCDSRSIPFAAEVLEVRSLLSAGASAVRAAVHHAAVESPAAKLPPIFQGSVDALVQITPFGNQNPGTGTALIQHSTLTVGSKMTASYTISFSDNGTPATIKGTISGTIQGSDPEGDLTFYPFQPTGGKVTLTETVAGKTIKATATPSGNTITLVMKGSSFVQLGFGDTFSQKAKGGFAGEFMAETFAVP